MSPEERAAALRERVMEAVFHDGRELDEIDALIATAIREAEDAAYERAAAHIMAGVAQDGKGSISVGDELLRHGAHWSAQRVLNLKSQEP